MIIRQATSGDADGIAALLSKSFLEDTAVIRVSIENNPRYSISNMYVLEDKSLFPGIAGCLRITPFEVFSRGVKMPMAGIAAVAVQPNLRKRGIADALMNDALRRMYEMEYPVSMLFPFRHSFYKRFGYGYVGNVVQYRVSPGNLSTFPERVNVRGINKTDRPKLKRMLLEDLVVHGAFTPVRNDSFWELVVFPKLKDTYVYDDGETKGYIAFDLSKDLTVGNETSGQSVLNIREFVALDEAAHRGLWGFVGALADQVTVAKYLAPADYPLHLFLKEPREFSFERLFFEYKTLSTLASGFMLRVVDVMKSLVMLGQSVETQMDVSLRINDGNLPQNSRAFNLHLHKGEATIDETKLAPQFETDIEIFSQIYSGLLKPSDAMKYGFAVSDERTARKLDDVFLAPAPFVHQFDIF